MSRRVVADILNGNALRSFGRGRFFAFIYEVPVIKDFRANPLPPRSEAPIVYYNDPRERVIHYSPYSSGLFRGFSVGSLFPSRLGGLTPTAIGALCLSWARLLAVLIAVLLVVSPSTLEHSFPEWRNSYGLIAFGAAGCALFISVARFFKGTLTCVFWFIVIGLISKGIYSVPTQQPLFVADEVYAPVAREEYTKPESWVDMFSDKEVELTEVNSAVYSRPRAVSYSRNARRRMSQDVPLNQGLISSVIGGGTGLVHSAITGSLGNLEGTARTALLAPLGLAGSTSMSPDYMDGGGSGGVLPDSVYFARPYQPGGELIDPSITDSLPSVFGEAMKFLGR